MRGTCELLVDFITILTWIASKALAVVEYEASKNWLDSFCALTIAVSGEEI